MKNEKADILLVEDRMEDAYLTEYSLNDAGFTSLHWVQDGDEAIDYLLCRNDFASRPDVHPKLILLDLKMPKVSGLEVLDFIKNDEKLKSIPVVMLTTSSEEIDKISAYNSHANSYIVKPVDSDKFKRVVSQLGEYWLKLNTNQD